jgi:putative NADH-flavin reductase
MRVCSVGTSGKLGRYMVQHALDRGYEVVGVCRERSVGKLDAFKGRITVIPGFTNDRAVIKQAVAGSMACSPCRSPGGRTTTRREPPRRCSTVRRSARA